MINHVAIIMDGNRRYAKARFMPAIFGHKAGFDNIKKITGSAKELGVQHLTLWALSTENFKKREKQEIDDIVKLIHHAEKLVPEFDKEGVKIQTIGDIEALPKKTREVLTRMKEATKNNTGIILTTALVYGGQNEIVRATKKILKEGVYPDTLDETSFRKYLDTSILPEPDLIIRTGGDIRHSGYLLYDSAYSEYYFSKKMWPEFSPEDLEEAINIFTGSKRNFGK